MVVLCLHSSTNATPSQRRTLRSRRRWLEAGDTDLTANNSTSKITWFDCYYLNDRGNWNCNGNCPRFCVRSRGWTRYHALVGSPGCARSDGRPHSQSVLHGDQPVLWDEYFTDSQALPFVCEILWTCYACRFYHHMYGVVIHIHWVFIAIVLPYTIDAVLARCIWVYFF